MHNKSPPPILPRTIYDKGRAASCRRALHPSAVFFVQTAILNIKGQSLSLCYRIDQQAGDLHAYIMCFCGKISYTVWRSRWNCFVIHEPPLDSWTSLLKATPMAIKAKWISLGTCEPVDSAFSIRRYDKIIVDWPKTIKTLPSQFTNVKRAYDIKALYFIYYAVKRVQ